MVQETTKHRDLGKAAFSKFLIGPRFRILRHFLLISFILILAFGGTGGERQYVGSYELIIKYGFLFFCIGIVYFNMYVLVPKLLFKDRFWSYLMAVLLVIALVFAIFIPIEELINSYRLEPHENKTRTWISFISFIFVLGVYIAASTAIKLLQKWIVDSERIDEMEKLTIKSELEQLKNQINPHFLFNMLNNVNVLTLKDPEKASSVVLTLSDLLRYQLYDTSRSKVLLTADIQFITDFLNLENIRRDNFSFTVSSEGEINDLMVPPLLFIPFVENATKHNTTGDESPYVYIFFRFEDGLLNFSCINSKSASPAPQKKQGGLGLNNIRRRLELLYPGSHSLSINENHTSYTVNLLIKI